jgi:hypothetical protein
VPAQRHWNRSVHTGTTRTKRVSTQSRIASQGRAAAKQRRFRRAGVHTETDQKSDLSVAGLRATGALAKLSSAHRSRVRPPSFLSAARSPCCMFRAPHVWLCKLGGTPRRRAMLGGRKAHEQWHTQARRTPHVLSARPIFAMSAKAHWADPVPLRPELLSPPHQANSTPR